MARVDADTNGSILKVIIDISSEKHPSIGATLPGTVYSKQFDEVTNQSFLTSYAANPNQFTMPGGTLTQTPPSGPSQVVTINPPSPYYYAYLNSQDILSRLSGDQAAIAAAAFRANGFTV